MSGGSHNYAYRYADDMAESLDHDRGDPEVEAWRRAFGAHLRKVAAAMKAIEWVDSCDWGPGDEVEAIKAALADVGVESVDPVPPAVRAELEALAARVAALEGA